MNRVANWLDEKGRNLFENQSIILFIIFSTLLIFLGYDKPWILIPWLVIGFFFYKRWEHPQKQDWLTIFLKLSFWMLIAENAVIILTGALQYNFYNIFYNVPHWLIIAYANTILFIAMNYRDNQDRS